MDYFSRRIILLVKSMLFELDNFDFVDLKNYFFVLFRSKFKINTTMTMSKTSVYPAHRRILDNYVVTKAVQQFEKLLKDEVSSQQVSYFTLRYLSTYPIVKTFRNIDNFSSLEFELIYP